jgi:hypothetical protein
MRKAIKSLEIGCEFSTCRGTKKGTEPTVWLDAL